MPDPTIQFIEMNWSLISDLIMEYLRACGTEQEVANLVTQWKDLQKNLADVSPKIPDAARQMLMAIPKGIAAHKRLDLRWWASQLEEWSLMLKIQRARQQRRG